MSRITDFKYADFTSGKGEYEMKYLKPELQLIGTDEDVITISSEDWGSGGGTDLATIGETVFER